MIPTIKDARITLIDSFTNEKLKCNIVAINVNYMADVVNYGILTPSRINTEIKIKNIVFDSESLFEYFNNKRALDLLARFSFGRITYKKCIICRFSQHINDMGTHIEEILMTPETQIIGNVKVIPPLQTFIFR